MKLLAVTAATLLVGVLPATVNAAVVDPVGYTEDFCRLRRSGVANQDAIQRAVMSNIDYTRDTVSIDGTDLDVKLGAHGTSLLCPDYL